MIRVGSRSKTTWIELDEKKLHVTVEAAGHAWSWGEDFSPFFQCVEEGENKGMGVEFAQAEHISHEEVHNGTGSGIRSIYRGFTGGTGLEFETYVWVEDSTEDVYFEWIPVSDPGHEVKKVFWPGYMAFDAKRDDWYTLVTEGQGLLVPNTGEAAVDQLHFNGMFLTSGSYMPWFSQIREGRGYIAIALTPWNGGVEIDHPGKEGMEADRPGNGAYTHVGVRWEDSLGSMEYRRILRFSFRDHCDYNDMCKLYRSYVFENGLAATLAVKAARIPSLNRLFGCFFVHCGIKTNVNPKSDFFDKEAPGKNNAVTTFFEREAMIRHFRDMGVEKLYLHLDGWAEPGYDNGHPDYLPACEAAGGWAGMKRLADAMKGWGYLFGIHDQYRDYYFDAPSFDKEYAISLPDGSMPEHKRWAGGPQSYLCASQAPFYVKRNFGEIKKQGISLDGAYLDVFTCNEGDECASPRHRMTRRDCYEYRKRCFDWLISQGILPSSEEVSDWSMNSLVFCHYAPYSFMLEPPGRKKKGVPVPLFNLVYHDCVIEPWMMERHDKEDYMLYALLNGGAPYLRRDGAYPGTDGAYDTGEAAEGMSAEEHLKRCTAVARLHERVAGCEMVKHSFPERNENVQETEFSDGTRVRIDLGSGEYKITCP